MNFKNTCNDLTIPSDGSTVGRLVFTRGAANLTVRADPTMIDLCRARFHGVIPEVRSYGNGVVEIHYPRFGFFSWLLAREETRAELVLNNAVPWSLEILGGLSGLDADLRAIDFRRLDVRGGASKAFLQFGRPAGAVGLSIQGGASDFIVSRPEGSAARCSVHGGITGLSFNERRFGAIGGDTSLETDDFKTSGGRFDFEIDGGASGLSMETHAVMQVRTYRKTVRS